MHYKNTGTNSTSGGQYFIFLTNKQQKVTDTDFVQINRPRDQKNAPQSAQSKFHHKQRSSVSSVPVLLTTSFDHDGTINAQ